MIRADKIRSILGKNAMRKIFKTYYDSEIGPLEIIGTEKGITGIRFVKKKSKSDAVLPAILKIALQQLDEYFKGKRKDFTVELILEGTDFQKKIWRQLRKIPYGKTISYLELAKRLGDEKVIRAAASANGQNPIPIIIPCHRVIGNDGSLTGYAGGLLKKQWLLEHEGAIQQRSLVWKDFK